MTGTRTFIVVAAAAALAPAACGDADVAVDASVDDPDAPAPDAAPACLAPGTYEEEISVGGYAQPFRLHVPAGRAEPAPVIMQLHGGSSTGAAMDTVSGLSALADTEGFLVVTPEGWPAGGSGPQVWNAGACCGPSTGAPDHVAALAAVLDRVAELDPCVDPRRVYVTGHSNGGIMTYRLACELGDRIAAVAVSAGYIADQDLETTPPTAVYTCAPPRPVPVLHVHGLADACVPYAGGLSKASGQTSPPIEDVIAGWRDRNDCADGSDVTAGDVRRRAWPCADGASVELITVAPLGHAWAGSAIYGNPQLCGGATTSLVSTRDELWRFFQAHALP